MNTKRAMIGATVVAATVGSVFLSSTSAFAHGLVSPDSRYGTSGQACAAGSTSGGDLKGRQIMPKNIQNGLVGQALYEPQSLEGPASWDDGKLDGKIPSGGWSAGVAHRLNEQTPTLWEKQEFQQGQTVTAGWCFAAPHSTKNFEYFITKNGWDPNKPLTRDSFERAPLTTVNGNNAMPVTGLHQIKLPADRTGYHIILSKWNIGDTSMAFYNVSDLNIKGGEAIEKPSTPSGLHHMGVTASQVKLMWNASDRATAYEILRNNQTIAEIPSTAGVVEYADTQVSPNTDYVYKVRAVNSAGVSDYSNALSVKTPDGPSQSKPSVSQAWLVKKDNGQTLVSVKGKGTPGSQVFVKASNGSWSDRQITVGANGEFSFISGYYEKDGVTVQLRKDGQSQTSDKVALQAAPATISTPAAGSSVERTFTVTGKGEAGAEITVKAGSTEARTTVKADKTWTVNLANVATGAQELSAVQTIDKVTSTPTKHNITVADSTTPGDPSDPSDPSDPTLPTWDPRAAYTKGDRVTHNGTTYECVQSYQGNGDPNWISALSLWKPVNG